jgi:hypothetical protein
LVVLVVLLGVFFSLVVIWRCGGRAWRHC